MKVIPIVQVRMGSTRLPGKALKEIAGKPMLWHIVNRLKHARLVSEVVIATSNKEGNEPIVKFAADNGIECYAGSEDDILDRFYQAVKKHNPDAVIRVTGDCPLVDPAIIDGMIRYYLNPKNGKPRFDVICNYMPPTYPDGLDVDLISFKVWEKAWRKLKSPWREWVPTYFFEHPERYRLGNMAYKEDLSHMRWTVDYPEDLDFVTRIYEKLYQEGEVFLMADILKLLAEHPELNEINKNYTIAAPSRRELRERNFHISPIFRMFPWLYRLKYRYYDVPRIHKFHPIYMFNLITRLGPATRKGECKECGACCGKCVYLEKRGDKYICTVYEDRPIKCNTLFPLCNWELRKNKLGDKCGYYWQTKEAR